MQEQAITLACGTEHRIVSVTGPAGTGKTTIQKRVYEGFAEAGYTIAVCAPTGKAAKRISEATGLPATTIHKLLEYTHPGDPDPKTGKTILTSYPRRTRENPLTQMIVFADEYSMVNKEVNRCLIDALPPGALLRCFGDVNQLPPIEEGSFNSAANMTPSPFMDHLKRFPSVVLKNIYRQGEGSGIVQNAAKVLKGFMPMQLPDCQLRMAGTTDNIIKLVEDLVMKGDVDYKSLDNQIITPMNISKTGTIAMNIHIQNLLQGDKLHEGHVMPRSKWDKVKSLVLVPGDKILWMKNDYQLEIFNGETGIVEEIVHDQVMINFGDRTIAVPPWVEYTAADGSIKGYDPRTQLNLAYVVTTHKAQGCQYDNVIYIMSAAMWLGQDRSNFYTALTRAKAHATIVSDQRSLQGAVTTVKQRVV